MQKLLLITAIAAVTYVAACAGSSAGTSSIANNSLPASNAAQPDATKTPVDDAPRITIADAKKDYDAGTAVIVDVRAESAYKEEHIKGSLNITIDTLSANLNKLPKGKKIIAYCS
jgi:3-mercaptopyruvate sulfurtransferase SseA